MGKAFRSPAARIEDTATLTSAETDILGPGESITYFTKLPHRAATRLADEGTFPVLDATGKRIERIDIKSGTMQQIKLEEGIVSWTLRDEADNPVRWDKTRATELIDGLDDDLRSLLLDRIGSKAPAALTDEEVNDAGLIEPVGNA